MARAKRQRREHVQELQQQTRRRAVVRGEAEVSLGCGPAGKGSCQLDTITVSLAEAQKAVRDPTLEKDKLKIKWAKQQRPKHAQEL